MAALAARSPARPRRRLPPRYADGYDRRFRAEVAAALAPGAVVLDVGAGARPTVPPADRPAACTWVGVDRSASELAKAPSGAYDESLALDIADPDPRLEARFDLAVSFQVLEHVDDIGASLENTRRYLRRGGRLIAQLSGAFSAFALANRVLPSRAKVALLERLAGRDPDWIFPARYDRCWYGALARLLATWSEFDIEPLYFGASYLNFAPPLRSLYLGYEEWARSGDRRNLATHYLIRARR